MTNHATETYSCRSIVNIDRQILACTDNKQRLLLFARKAGQLARFSCLSDAQLLVTQLRTANSEYDASTSARINLAEGLITHFSALDNASAKNKFNRAFLIAQMGGDREAAATAAAWLAHCELVSGNMTATATHLASAFEWADDVNHEALGRASVVLADALSWSGQTELAKHWYRKARDHAVHDGDIAMQNVMLFNAANFSVAELNLRDCCSPLESSESKRATLDVASAANLNNALGIDSLSSLIPIMQAELLVVQQKWQDAAIIFDGHGAEIASQGQSRLLPRIFAQRAWCQANLCNKQATLAHIKESLAGLDQSIDLDDLAVLYFRLGAAAGLLQNTEQESRHRSLGENALRLFRSQQIENLKILSNFLKGILSEIKNPA